MGTPELADQVREVPVRVLRAIFAGVGRLLLVADRLRAEAGRPGPHPASADDAPDPLTSRPAQAPGRGRSRADRSRWRSLDATGNVRVLTGDEEIDSENGPSGPTQAAPAARSRPAASKPATGSPGKPAPRPAASKPAVPELAAKRPAPRRAAASPAAAAPPPGLPGYDELSLASLRARLRGLDLPSVQAALTYERAHAGRPEVIGMFERRIEKLSGAA